jgi:hypothetical protein
MSDLAIRLSLSAKGLQGVEAVNHENDFAFIVGDERYSCPSFLAEFLSPRVAALRSEDITISEFSIKTSDPDHFFGTLLSIGFGREVSFPASRLGFVRAVSKELLNCELFEKTLKEKDGEIEEEDLKARLDFLSGVDEPSESAVSVVASHFYQFSVSDFDRVSPSVLEAILRDSALIVGDEDSVFEIVHRLASADLSYFRLLEFVRFEFVSTDCMTRVIDFLSTSFESFTFGIWSSLHNRLGLSVTPPSQPGRFRPLPAFDSKIISSIPDIFSVFEGKTLTLLYRGSRDGFEARTFHSRCDRHPNTVTLILSTNECIFGGYTPVEWSSRGTNNNYVPDPSRKSFIFSIKNPHNLPARIFEQKQQGNAINDRIDYGPVFGNGCDLWVGDQCQKSRSSGSRLGTAYANDTGITGYQVLTGAQDFTVQEIEVFEVI